MVLSNKKLKQQIRTKFAEISNSKDPDFETVKNPDFEIVKNPDFEIVKNPETPKSLKQLLDSTTQNPRLSKREKRRESLSTDENKDTHVEGTSRGKKRRREKIDGETGSGVDLKVDENSGGVELKVDDNGGGVELKVDDNGGGVELKVDENGGVELKVDENGGGVKREVDDNGVEGQKLSVKKMKKLEKNKRKEKERNDLIEKVRCETGGRVEPNVDENGSVIELIVEKNGGEVETLSFIKLMQLEKKKKKERERNGLAEKSEGNVELGVKEVGNLSNEDESPVMKNKKKKKKKSKSKSKDNIKNEENQSEVDNVLLPEQIITETSQEDEDDCKKVYVGGMPYSSTEDDMWSYFDHCGTITDIDCMKFPETGKFRGIAFISFKTEEAAKKALALDGSEMDGFYLKIQPYKATRTTKSSALIPPVIEGYNRIYAGNLAWDITEEDLRKFLSDCNITSIRFGEDKETGEFKGYAHVDFSDSDSVTNALKLDQQVVCGRPVKISRAVPTRGAIKIPESTSATSTVKPLQNNIVVKPPAAKPEEKYSDVISAAVKPEESYNEVVPAVVKPPENNTGVSSGKLKRRTCYECGERGHISSACPKKQATE